MKKEVFDIIRHESIYIGILFLIALAIFKIAFFNESLIVVFKTALSLLWVFVLPGYFIMLYWHEKLDFMERFVIGIFASASLTGIFSYYLGLFGLDTKYHVILFPALVIAISLLFELYHDDCKPHKYEK